jgi:hypothetical protein
MATSRKQNKKNSNLPKSSVEFLPSYYQSDKNSKFLSSTIDQLLNRPEISRLYGYAGSKLTASYDANQDNYLPAYSKLRQDYQLEPGLVIRDQTQQIKKAFGFDDLINQLSVNDVNTSNFNNLFTSRHYSYNPPIDWDKLINFNQYYWLSSGPRTILISGISKTVSSNYTVTDSENGDSYIFSPNGFTPNPTLILYRGETYIFTVNSSSNFYIKTSSTVGTQNLYTFGVEANGKSQVTFTVPENAPSKLWYGSDSNQLQFGELSIKDKNETTTINVDDDIIGKKFYTTVVNDIELSLMNGMKIRFTDDVLPIEYRGKEFYVDGVGESITLTDTTTLQTPEEMLASLVAAPFDGSNFDEFPFDAYKNIPIIPEYITINRSSMDRNSWSRYNRWFHVSVIEQSAQVNGVEFVLNNNLRASRPIIEFKPNLQLFQYGDHFLTNVTAIDTVITNVFSTIENYPVKYGVDPSTKARTILSSFTIDGIYLDSGQTVVFNADTDFLVRGKVYTVSVIMDVDENGNTLDTGRINLVLADQQPVEGSVLLVTQGQNNAATQWWFTGGKWNLTQTRSQRNQPPLFELYDNDFNSYYDPEISTFTGNKIFGYKIGSGPTDPVLGFPLSYSTDIKTVGMYEFSNYFSDQTFYVNSNSSVTIISSDKSYYKINSVSGSAIYTNIWTTAYEYKSPIIQVVDPEQLIYNQVDDSTAFEVTAVENTQLLEIDEISVFVQNTKVPQVELVRDQNKTYVKLTGKISEPIHLKITTDSLPANAGYYEAPLSLTNNPYNRTIIDFSFSEISSHVKSMVDRSADFKGNFPGRSNLNSLADISKYGTKIIVNESPISYAQHFISDADHSIIPAIRMASDSYNNFKMAVINSIEQLTQDTDAVSALDTILISLNQNKNATFSYASSDMIPYGNDYTSKTYTVTDSRNTYYALSRVFDLRTAGFTSVLVYLNNSQLCLNTDYVFDQTDAYVNIIHPLNRGDIITIKEYTDTFLCFVAPTPTKLGLYPKFLPQLYLDTSYAGQPQLVIQGHDGSLTRSYGDFRDQVLLEFEKRIYNNIKCEYNHDFVDSTVINPGAYRKNKFTRSDINNLQEVDFLKWTNLYGIDFESNTTYDITNHKTYNYRSGVGDEIGGNWRSIYKYYFDTDRPNTHPWEMLGFSMMPEWWTARYGPAPYTAGNKILWDDLQTGFIADGPRKGIDQRYARPGLENIIPVDDSGNTVDIREWAVIGQISAVQSSDSDWQFGDHGPSETAWRRSSYYPFSAQIAALLTSPTRYAALNSDPTHIVKNAAGQYVYIDGYEFISTSKLPAALVTNKPICGWLNYVVERGKTKSKTYVSDLINQLSNADFNLIHKVGGFLSKEKIQILIDSISPNSPDAGLLLPQEDFNLFFNSSGVAKAVSISGIIIKKQNGYFTVSGYDLNNPRFTILQPIHLNGDKTITIGGKSRTFTQWVSGNFYQAGQIVSYNNQFYMVLVSNSSQTFDSDFYSRLPELPITGGVSVTRATRFQSLPTQINYGTRFFTIQQVYDFIVGYGKWLESQGFVFDYYSSEIAQTINWDFTSKEFLYWTTQSWGDGSVISLSPFANKLILQIPDYYVNNFLDDRYQYSILKVDGTQLDSRQLTISRDEASCKLETGNTQDGIFFVRFNLIQKEHVIVLNNYTMFNDVVYDSVTGSRQARIMLQGFKTSEWNGDYFSPGFVYDAAKITDWQAYTDYITADVVKYSGNYYCALANIPGSATFDYTKWVILPEKPTEKLLPNFEYKIQQFNDFYSLDVDNIDLSQQFMAQNLIGYNSRPYLQNIFVNPIAQYKFYQGYIREKGTKNSVDKLAKAGLNSLYGQMQFTEEWAFRTGWYGGYTTFKELQVELTQSDFLENPQVVLFSDTKPAVNTDNFIYVTKADLSIYDQQSYESSAVFSTTSNDTLEDNQFVMPVAGYVRPDDVTATALNINALLDISNNSQIFQTDTIWVGFADTGDWDVYRYSIADLKINAVTVTNPGLDMVIDTDKNHNFSVGQLVSIIGLDESVNGIYTIQSVPGLKKFSVNTELNVSPVLTTSGLVGKFQSSRFDTFDDLENLQDIADFKFSEMVWVDRDLNNRWVVYKKVDNFNLPTNLNGQLISNQRYGASFLSPENSDINIISAPSYFNDQQPGLGYGRVFVNQIITGRSDEIVSYSINTSTNFYYQSDSLTDFGISLAYTVDKDVIIAGAPLAGNIKSDTSGSIRFARNINAIDSSTEAGLIKISHIDRTVYPVVMRDHAVLVNSVPQDYAHFGSSILLSDDGTKLLVGAPGQNTNTGVVYHYTVDIKTTSTQFQNVQTITTSSVTLQSEFGSNISGDLTASVIAVSAPGQDSSTGCVYVYRFNGTEYQYDQTLDTTDQSLSGLFKMGDRFGHALTISADGEYLIVSSLRADSNVIYSGKVVVYKYNGEQYNVIQVIDNPSKNTALLFGQSISIDQSAQTLVITALGNNRKTTGFDNQTTIFDVGSSIFTNNIVGSGTTFVFNRHGEKFIFAQELFDTTVSNNSDYGQYVLAKNNAVYVGAPRNIYNDDVVGSLYIYNKIDRSQLTWQIYRSQDDMVDLSKINRVAVIDSDNQRVVEYAEIIDPAKGKFPGIADQEIHFKTAYDPAVYSLGSQNVTVDITTNWLDTHVGELWWDISTVKYIWYEQGDLKYRKNNWGETFPGSTIDVYEWVRSEYLPSQWAQLADTTAGLAEGISGQPKHPDDRVLSVGQYYNAVSGTYTNVYYFWVKNKTLVANRSSRKISAYEVSRLLQSPRSANYTYASVISSNSISLTNFKPVMSGKSYALNIAFDQLSSPVNRHTEWLLLDEQSTKSIPAILEKKLYDSLIGRDSSGNTVPDISLPEKMRYGISVRPRQSMFKNRKQALRNVIYFANSVLSENIITGRYSLNNLNKQQPIPGTYTGEYDIVVEDQSDLKNIDTSNFEPAEITATIDTYGRISAINIINPGLDYGRLYLIHESTSTWVGPTINEISNDASIQLQVDAAGSVVDYEIINSGQGFEPNSILQLDIRPYTVLVTADTTSNGKWAKYTLSNNNWVRTQVQSFNTTLYWDYVDWVSPAYNQLQPFFATVPEPYYLNQLEPNDGQYIKVLNSGDNRSIVLQKISSGAGTYNSDYDIVFSERGTIQLSSSIWDDVNSIFGFDQVAAFDQTLYDQSAETEILNILNALKQDIFINELAANWTGLFFAAVRYAFSEQKILDWAFKTSFINVKNTGAFLDQRPVYKFQTSQYFNDYLNEVKPYHTQIRSFSTVYSRLEPSNTLITDFDIPTFYDRELNQYRSIGLQSEEINQYPYKSWADNYKYQVESINVVNGGSGYNSTPQVTIIPAEGDIITTTATAVAYISRGSVSGIQVINPGYGYTKNPSVLIQGGGNSQAITATAYAVLKNYAVRTNIIGIKFDRIYPTSQITSNSVTDVFVTDGTVTEFELTWAAEPDNETILVTATSEDYGIKLVADQYIVQQKQKDYIDPVQFGTTHKSLATTVKLLDSVIEKEIVKLATTTTNADTVTDTITGSDSIFITSGTVINSGQLVSFTETSIGITTVTNVRYDQFIPQLGIRATQITVSPRLSGAISKGTRLKFIDPATATRIEITYNKNINLMSAAERILHYYNPVSGMPGNNLDQLMSGISFPGIQLITLPFNYSSNWDQMGFDTVFWQDSDNLAKLDTVIDGGNLVTGTNFIFTSAAGVNPEDIIIDGDKFISEASSHAPEEMVPGELKESLGINVFTRVENGTPDIYSSTYQIVDNTKSNTFKLPTVPVSEGAMSVSFNNSILIENQQFSVDYQNQAITIFPQPTSGLVLVTIVGVGGKRFLSTDSITVTGSKTAAVKSTAIYTDVLGAYVTVNGVAISTDTNQTTYYTIAPFSSRNKRATAKVYGLSTGTNTVTAWFFNSAENNFNQINEQRLQYTGENNIPLDFPPRNLWSQSSQAIVEVNNLRLVPPNTTYYTVSNQQRVFDIDPYGNYPQSSFDYTRLEVYVNGIIARDIFDYKLDTVNSTVTFDVGYVADGDQVAITILKDCDYKIVNDVITFFPQANLQFEDEIRIVTFSNHDQLSIVQQVFDAHYSGLYRLAYPVVDDNFIWVSVGRKVLANKVDFKILPDGITVKIDDSVEYIQTDQVVVTTFRKKLSDEVIAYRIFHDMLGRISYKRLCEENSTYLTEPLYTTSTSISVFNAGILPVPAPESRIPGVILIDGERIEYMEKNGNTLSRLHRATLGTGAKDFYPINTRVVDQGVTQTVPFTESVFSEQIVTTNTTTYQIAEIAFDSGIEPHDQVEVTYGGRLLRKPTPASVVLLRHNFELAYDSGQNNSNTVVEAEFTIDSNTGNLVLAFVPESGKIINIVKRQSTTWYETGDGLPTNGQSLLVANTPQAEFLRQKTAFLPDKYHYAEQ